MDVSSRRLVRVLHRHLAEHGLLSFLSLLRAFRLNVIKRNQAIARYRHERRRQQESLPVIVNIFFCTGGKQIISIFCRHIGNS